MKSCEMGREFYNEELLLCQTLCVLAPKKADCE